MGRASNRCPVRVWAETNGPHEKALKKKGEKALKKKGTRLESSPVREWAETTGHARRRCGVSHGPACWDEMCRRAARTTEAASPSLCASGPAGTSGGDGHSMRV